MREWADFTVQEGGGRITVVLEGPLVVSSIGLLDRKLRDFTDPVQHIDMSQAGDIDTVGAWIVARFADEHRARITGASEQAQNLIATVRENASTAPLEPPRAPVLERVVVDTGEKVVSFGHGVKRFVGFLGETILAAGRVIAPPLAAFHSHTRATKSSRL